MIHSKTTNLLSIIFVLFALSVSAQRNIKREEANKKLVVTFYQKLFGDKDLSVIDRYIADDYIQHNPTMTDGKKGLKDAVTKWFEGAPKEKVDIPHVAADGDLVFLHVRGKNQQGELQAIVDIFRVKNNKIVEHWDVIQDAPKQSANDHPMF